MSSVILAHQQRGVPVDELFERKELVGKGAYGGVYKGVHKPTGLVVALKVIDLDTPDDDISEIQKEVALLSEMRDAARHNITLYHGCYLSGHELWIAMDFASGGSIRTLMKSGSIEEKYIVVIIREVLVALSFLDRQGIIHRDVKGMYHLADHPANVLLTQAGQILLCDFGVAAHLQTNNKRSTFIGTPLWMAPEVITDGKLYDTKADIWSLGITCYEIATGNPPYFGMEPLRACALIPRSTPARLEGGSWSTPMRDFLAQCLQIDPTSRPTADELARHKWIKAASKVPMTIMRELINRYVNWVQRGGQRASLAGVESLAREDTFDIEEDSWDFDDVQDEPFAPVETLGDEPPRSLDAQAAANNKRPPKQILPRSHPLMRLFDEDSNAYSAPKLEMTINLPSGPVDTVRPTISIPSLDDANDFYDSNPSSGINLAIVEDLMTPATIRSQPFSWLQQQQPTKLNFGGASAGTSAPFGDEDWGSSSFMSHDSREVPPTSNPVPVPTSPSLPTIPLDRPLQSPNRKRADTAPSSDYPPLGPGIPAFFQAHSNQTSVSSQSSNTSNSLFSNGSFASSQLSSSPPTMSKPFAAAAGTNSPAPFGRMRPFDQDANRPFKGRQSSDAARQLKLGSGHPPLPPASGGSLVGVNGDSRSRTGSDASMNRKQGTKANGSGISPSVSTVSHSRQHSRQHSRSHSRTGSGILAYKLSPSNTTVQLPPQPPTSIHAWSAPVTAVTTPVIDGGPDVSPPSHWTDEAFIQAAGGPSHIRTPLALAASGVSAEPNSFPFPSATPLAHQTHHVSTPSGSIIQVKQSAMSTVSAPNFRASVIGRPGGAVLDLSLSSGQRGSSDQAVFDQVDEDEEDDFVEVNDSHRQQREQDDEIDVDEQEASFSNVWPLGPSLNQLDYSCLATKEQVQEALNDTLEQLGQWLDGIDRGLAKVVQSDDGGGQSAGVPVLAS
ncbi:kinase that interacts with cdc31p [Microbotryomycetes sp. JL201]|nr:kinase that interacts with cdc31p [Microbotryomycetes sp. JL201]